MTKVSGYRKITPTVNDDLFGIYQDKTPVRFSFEAVAELINGFNNTTNNPYLQKTTGEAIPSHTPVAIVDNLAYKFNSANPNHQFAFAGFSINGTSAGEQICNIIDSGEIELSGWGLVPNTHYLAGINGTIIMENTSSTNFTKIIGYARTSNILEIIKDSITINK